MRTFFALLVLANLLLLLVFGREVPLATDSPRQPLESGHRLVLLSELRPTDRPGPRVALSPDTVPAEVNVARNETAELKAETESELKPEGKSESVTETRVTAKPASERCYRLEGIADAKALSQAKSRMAAIGAHVNRTGETAFDLRRYWVVLPRFRSREEALPVMTRLRAAGIEDFYFVPSGENKNTLSLGMFSTAEAAQRRVTQVAPLKLKVHTREVASPGKRFFLEVSSAKSAAALTDALNLSDPRNLRVRACSSSQ